MPLDLALMRMVAAMTVTAAGVGVGLGTARRHHRGWRLWLASSVHAYRIYEVTLARRVGEGERAPMLWW